MSSTQLSFKELLAELSSIESAVIASHVSPDPDALGSACGLQQALSAAGKEVWVYAGDGVPERLESLLSSARILTDLNSLPDSFDAFITVDTANKPRVAAPFEELERRATKTLNIDHHGSNSAWADLNYVEATTTATAVIVAKLVRAADWPLSAEAANALYAGLVDDSGSFRFSNTNAEAFEFASYLLAAGASPEFVSNELYYANPLAMISLQARCLSTLKLHQSGLLATVYVTQAMLEECGAEAQHAEGLVDIARSVKGVEVAVFVRELGPTNSKLSLRAKSSLVNVSDVAAVFGGGGHPAAAGCRIDANASEAIELVRAEVVKQLDASTAQ